MAKPLILKNCFFEADGIDLTCEVRSVEISLSKPAVEANSMCGKSNAHGMEDSTITVNLKQNFDAGSVDDTFWGHWKAETEFPVVVRPKKDDPVSATNPNYTATVKLFDYVPLSGSVGDLAETSIAMPVEGEVGKELM